MMSCHADEEKYQFLERIFLYKNQIIELHQQHYDLEKRMYYGGKYLSKSIHIYQLPSIILPSVNLLKQISSRLRLNPFLEALTELARKDRFTIEHNSRWLKEPFYIYSLYIQLAVILDYLVLFLSKVEASNKDKYLSVYWTLIYMLFSCHEEDEISNERHDKRFLQNMEQIYIDPQVHHEAVIEEPINPKVDNTLKEEYLPENETLELIMQDIIAMNFEALKELAK